eukprot:scaffold437749_cov38-Prasinocladus_malaysianus.AAC.1
MPAMSSGSTINPNIPLTCNAKTAGSKDLTRKHPPRESLVEAKQSKVMQCNAKRSNAEQGTTIT